MRGHQFSYAASVVNRVAWVPSVFITKISWLMLLRVESNTSWLAASLGVGGLVSRAASGTAMPASAPPGGPDKHACPVRNTVVRARITMLRRSATSTPRRPSGRHAHLGRAVGFGHTLGIGVYAPCGASRRAGAVAAAKLH